MQALIHRSREATRTRRRLIPLICLFFVAILGTAAYAAPTDNQYATGINGVGGTYHTSGFDNRNYNKAWHQPGYEWAVWYQDTSGFSSCLVINTANPTTCNTNSSYKKSYCHNYDDNSGVTWSCNTTNGFGPGVPHSIDLASRPSQLGGVEGESRETARDVLLAFSRPRTKQDVLPSTLEADLIELVMAHPRVPEEVRPGFPDASQSRALLSPQGSQTGTLYLVPTTKRAVCYAFLVEGAIGCIDRFTVEAPLVWDVRDPDEVGKGESVIVSGLVPGPSVLSGFKLRAV